MQLESCLTNPYLNTNLSESSQGAFAGEMHHQSRTLPSRTCNVGLLYIMLPQLADILKHLHELAQWATHDPGLLVFAHPSLDRICTNCNGNLKSALHFRFLVHALSAGPTSPHLR